MILGVEHIGLMTDDTNKLAEWYRDILDLKIIYKVLEDEDNPIYFLKGKMGSIIEIFPKGNINGKESKERQKIVHIALLVDDFQKTVNRLYEKKVQIIGDEKKIFKDGKVLFFKDPIGNMLHIVYRPKPTWNLG